jgi:hypothetical protein
MYLTYSLEMIKRLPVPANSPDLDSHVQNACLESFFVNVRLMAEFLTVPHREGQEPKDFNAWDFTSDWAPAPGEAVKRVRQQWLVASQQVVHFSRNRLQDPDSPVHLDTSTEGLKRIADDVVAIYSEWLRQTAG